MNILITGGCGFIGSNILYKLTELSTIDRIIILDNNSTGYYQNIENVIHDNKVIFIEGDIRNFEDCNKALKNIDIVLHQAAIGSVPRSIVNPIFTHENNVNGFLNIIMAAKLNNIKKFIFAASSSTYGDSSVLPKVENIIGNPLSPYAVTKYVNELYADVFSRCYGLNYIGLRYFNVFGPNQDPYSSYAAVIPKFCMNILKGENLHIYGDGSVARDFTYVDNVVQANILSIFCEKKESLNQVYNVACGEMYSIKFLAEHLLKISGSNVKIYLESSRKGDIQFSQASIDKIKNNLGYSPNTKFLDGLEATWNFYLRRFKKD